MLSHMGNSLVLIKLEILMDKYETPFGVDKITGDLYAMEANSITIQDKATPMTPALPQVRASAGTGPTYPLQAFSPLLKTVTGLTLPAAESTWIPHAVSPSMSCDGDKRGTIGHTPESVASTCSSSGFSKTDLTQEMLDDISKQRISLKKHKLEQQLKTERQHHLAVLN